MTKEKKPKTQKQLISKAKELRVLAKHHISQAEHLVSECWSILAHSK